MYRYFLIYVKFVWFFVVSLFTMHKYLIFLERRFTTPAGGIRRLSVIVDNRLRLEKTKGVQMKREDLILQFFLNAMKERRERNQKSELFLPILLMLLWHCEPIDVKYASNDE